MILQRLAPFSRSERRTNASEIIVAYRLKLVSINDDDFASSRSLPWTICFVPYSDDSDLDEIRSRRSIFHRDENVRNDRLRSLYTRSVTHSPFVISSIFLFLCFYSAHASTNNSVSSARIPCPYYTSRCDANNFSSLFIFRSFRAYRSIGASC